MNYYYLVAGLPDISPTDRSVSMTTPQIVEEVLQRVNRADRNLLELYLHRHDNANLLALLSAHEGVEPAWDDAGLLTRAELTQGIEAISSHGRDAQTALPDYMADFLAAHLQTTDHDDPEAATGFALSRLSAAYYRRATALRNDIVARWFAYERDLCNLLTAFNCQRLGLDVAPYIVGDNDLAEALRTSKAARWGLTTADFPDLDQVAEIAEGTDALLKERRLDDLRIQHLDEVTALCHFGVERLFAFLVLTDVIRRWQRLNDRAGQEKLRNMIAALKQGAVNFKE